MIEQEIQIVQSTWQDIQKNTDPRFGSLFYNRLYEEAPNIRNCFDGESRDESGNFINHLGNLISELHQSQFIHDARVLGKKYYQSGLQKEHYENIRHALFWALRSKLGEKWTPNVMVSWIWFYSTISCIMMDGSRA